MVRTEKGETHLSLVKYHSGTTINPNLTRWLTGAGAPAAETNAQYSSTIAGYALNMRARCTVAPGAGETFIYTLNINGVGSALSVQIGGIQTEGQVINARVAIVQGDELSMEVVTSAAAAVAQHLVTMLIKITPP